MSLHGNPVHRAVTLPDGRNAELRVGIAEDSYVADRDLDTVVLELRFGGHVAAVVTTVLDADQESEAHRLAEKVADGLSSGALAPTAQALEPLADEL